MQDNLTSWVENPEKLADTCRELEGDMTSDRNLWETTLQLYYNRPFASAPSTDRSTFVFYEMSGPGALSDLGFNLSREIIDAGAAQICRPLHPLVQPVGADADLQNASEKLTRLVDGVMVAADYMDYATGAYLDAATASVGPIKWYADATTSEIKCERVDPTSMLWHYGEGRDPIHLYTVDSVSKVALKARFPGHHIDELPDYQPQHITGVDPTGIRTRGCARVQEGWRKKLGDQPGRHVIATDKGVLVNEEWDYDFFPIATYRWSPEFRSFGGVALGRLVAPYHVQRNQLVRNVADSLAGSKPWLLVHEDSNVNSVGDVAYQKVLWSGAIPPTVTVPNPVSSQTFKWIDDLRTAAFQECGINVQAAAGARPAGLNSAPSQREWIDIVNLRTVLQQRAWEKLAQESARIIVALAAVTYKKRGARVKAPGTAFLEEIKWGDINLKEDQYRMTFSLASGLSQTTSGRIEQLMMLKESGVIDTADVLRRIDLPDVAQLSDRINAPRDLAEKQVWKALKEGEFEMPSALQPLDPLIAIGAQEYQRALFSGIYPPANVDVLRKLISAARERQKQAATPAAPPMAAPPTAPALPPMAPEAAMAPLPSDVPPPAMPMPTAA